MILTVVIRSSIELFVFLQEFLPALTKIRIGHDAVNDRTDGLTLGLVVGSHALGAFERIDDINGVANRYGFVGTLDHARITGCTVIKDL
jgi:hypothetical protein